MTRQNLEKRKLNLKKRILPMIRKIHLQNQVPMQTFKMMKIKKVTIIQRQKINQRLLLSLTPTLKHSLLTHPLNHLLQALEHLLLLLLLPSPPNLLLHLYLNINTACQCHHKVTMHICNTVVCLLVHL